MREMATLLWHFVHEEQGQDLIEYTLLLAFVALAAIALFVSAGGTIQGVWARGNQTLGTANSIAGGTRAHSDD
jgi:Flp pilus assembly pilin Flp